MRADYCRLEAVGAAAAHSAIGGSLVGRGLMPLAGCMTSMHVEIGLPTHFARFAM